jgi:GT2 family glycosyltransferase
MVTNQIDLSIIIVNYKTIDFLIPCLSSIYKKNLDLNIEIIVIDNNSKDNSVARIKELFPLVIIMENESNLGFATASNQGLRLMKGNYALLLNPDTEVMNDTLARMLEFMKDNPRVGILCCKNVDIQGNFERTVHPTPSLIHEFSYFFYILKLDRILPSRMILRYYDDVAKSSLDPFPVGWVCGACLMINKETIKEIGLLDENLFMFFEDVDWCMRANKKGWKVMYHPHVSILHHEAGSSKTDINLISQRLEYSYKSKLYFARKHFGKKGPMVVKLASFLDLTGRIIFTALNLRPRITQQEKEMKIRGYMLALKTVLGIKR